MKLYEIPRGSKFRIVEDADTGSPPAALPLNTQSVYTLGNIDGMYSFCKDSQGNVVHVLAYADVVLVENK